MELIANKKETINVMTDKFLNKVFQKQNMKFRLTLLVSALGILLFIVAASFLPFKDRLFSSLYPKPLSHAADPTSFRFIAWADSRDDPANAVLSAMSKKAATLNPAFTFFPGDLCGSFDVNCINNIWKPALDGNSSNGILAKTFVSRGNHDSGNESGWQGLWDFQATANTVGAINYSAETANETYSFDYGNSHFVVIDDPDGGSKYMTGSHISWLDTDLTRAEQRMGTNLSHEFLILHGPIYAVTPNHGSEDATSSLIGILNRHPLISASFHGHEHITMYANVNGSRLSGITQPFEEFTMGRAGAPSYSINEPVDFSVDSNGFVSIDVNGADFTATIYKQDGTVAFTRTFTESAASSLTVAPTPILSTTGKLWHVATNGNDSNPGTLASPFATVNKANSVAAAGDTIYLRGGTYYINRSADAVKITKSGTASTPITISSYPGEWAIIDGTSSGIGQWDKLFLIGSDQVPYGEYSTAAQRPGDYVIVRNLEVANSPGQGVISFGNHVTISGVKVHHSTEQGILVGGDYDVVENSEVWWNAKSNAYFASINSGKDWSTGLSAARYPHYAILRGNKVYNNWGEGLSAYEADHATLEDNIVWDNMRNTYFNDTTYTLYQRNLVYCTPGNIFAGKDQLGLAVADERTNYYTTVPNHPSTPPVSSNNTIINSMIVGCQGNFVHWADTTGLRNYLIAYNTFVNSVSGGGYSANVDLASDNGTTNSRFVNNIIVQEDSRTIANVPSSGMTFANNLWSKTPTSIAAPAGSGSIVGNPQLAKTGSINSGLLTADYFKLLASSPAINVAAVLSNVPTDYFGTARGSSPDIGAYEYTTNGPISTPIPTPTLAPTSIPTLTPTPTSTPNSNLKTFGNTTLSAYTNPIGTDEDGSRFQLVESGNVQNLSAYFGNSGFAAKAAIYSDSNGTPGNLLTRSSSDTINTSGWHTFSVTSTTLSPGYYWLNVVADNTTAIGRSSAGTTNQHAWKSTTYTNEFSTSFGTPTGSDASATNIYASYLSVAASTPMSTPTPTSTPIPTPIADITSPAVSITSPVDGSQVSGIIGVSVSASDNVGVTKVEFYLDGSLKQTNAVSPYQWNLNTILISNGLHSLSARAYDAAGNTSSNSVAVNVLNGDTIVPSIPSSLRASTVSYNQVNLSWTVSTDNVGVAGYYVVRNGTTIATSATNSFSDTSVSPASSYSYYILAYDAAGNVSAASNIAIVVTPNAPDIQPPSVPANLTANAVSPSQINLSWTASKDNVVVAGYRVFRNSSQIATVNTTSYGDTGLTSSTAYTYYVVAYDGAGNVSSPSNQATVTTKAPSLATYGAITGTVYSSSGSAISGAQVNLVVNGHVKSYSTNTSGTYYVPKVPPGTYNISFVVRGKYSWMYYGISKTIIVYAGQTTVQNVTINTR